MSAAPHLQTGSDAEQAALSHLQAGGLQLLTRNYRCAGGELDLIMLHARELVFVEVRYRHNDDFGGATTSVTAAKQRKLRHAGETFLLRNPRLAYSACRFDVVAISGAAPYRIDWIQDAFA